MREIIISQVHMLTVKPPQLNFNNEGVPCSSDFDDPYFSLKNGIEESHHVFIKGNRLKQRWEHINAEDIFIIAELGFGFGINFLTTCQQWIQNTPKQGRLHYISFEKYPVSTRDLDLCYTKFNLHTQLSQKLIQDYPIAIEGSHRIHFDNYDISLTLIYGDALSYLKKSNFYAHAWFLDGFSPNKNPQLWNIEIAEQVYRLTQQHGTFATYSAASIVRKNFSSAGFATSKQEGFGSKRDMLIGERLTLPEQNDLPLKGKNWLNNPKRSYKNKTAIVIGAGMAGCFISAALAKRNWNVTLLDRHSSVASEASGNPNAILMPRLSLDHDVQSQLTLQGFLYTIRVLNYLKETNDFDWQQCGAIQLPRDKTQRKRMQRIANQKSIPEKLLTAINRTQASELAGINLDKAGWHIPLASWLKPSLLCETILQKYNSNIHFHGKTSIESLHEGNHQWIAHSTARSTYTADIIILANALAVSQFKQTQWCEFNPKRGQISFFPEIACNIQPKKIICSDAYITPECDSNLITGATFITNDTKTDIRSHEHEENLYKLSNMIPSFEINKNYGIKGRVAIRAVSDDRLPITGPAAVADEFFKDFKNAALGSTNHMYSPAKTYPGLYIHSAFGSRGLAWIPLCSEILACIINNEPSPVDMKLEQAIHPNRLLMKKLKSSQNTIE